MHVNISFPSYHSEESQSVKSEHEYFDFSQVSTFYCLRSSRKHRSFHSSSYLCAHLMDHVIKEGNEKVKISL